MNQNVLFLLITLVTVNIILIAVAVTRSMRRRRNGSDGYAAGAVRRPVASGVSAPIAPSNGPVPVSRTDGLTGLLLPGEWNRIVADEDARNHRYGRPATVVIVEIEGIDRLIGALGQDAGDRVLPAVADTLSRNARGADHLARLGPSRIGILLPETGEVEAINFVERVRSACDMWLESGAVALQLAIGWASPTPDTNLATAAALAQERMYTELRRNARRANDIEPDGHPPMHDIEGSPSPA